MPEGDSVFRFAARLQAALAGKVVLAARSHGPGPVPQVHRIVGASCSGVRARGKNLLISFDNGLALRGHLRMYGTWKVYGRGQPWDRPESQARLVLEVHDAVVANFSAPVIELIEERALDAYAPVAGLGPDLLPEDFDLEEACRRLRETSRAGLTIGDAIMDQRALAGVGNIWKHETLFHCGINPWRLTGELDDATLRSIVLKARALLRASAGKENDLGLRRRPDMYVYMRAGQACRRCSTRLRSARQGVDIRFTTWCPRCQPATAEQANLPVGRSSPRRPPQQSSGKGLP